MGNSKTITTAPENKNGKPDFLIVGIGASAGGIQALKEFFENVPADSGMAYVVILHLSPDHDSKLAEILQTVAAIPVAQVLEKIHLAPNHVYVVPPSKHLTMLDGSIEVSPNITFEDRRAPVDIFFRTLAESHATRAVSVIRVKERGAARPLPVPDSIPTLRFESRRGKTTRERENRASERITYGDLHQRLLEQYAAPSIVVNEEYDIVHLSERAGRFMQIAGGEPSNNLLKLIREEMRLELRTALYQAVQNQTNVEVKNLRLRVDDQAEMINLVIRPVLRPDDAARGFLLVLFEPADGQIDESEAVYTAPEPITRQLEDELIQAKSQLRSSNEHHETQAEELKASNEELQAMNEELRSAAEELETSKEELHSLNEELATVNQELKIKVEELSQSNNNFQNLINSTDIGTIFLDRTFRVMQFTPAAREIFNLIPADVGRSLSDITSKFNHQELLTDAETVLEKLQTVEREMLTRDGRFFLTRLSPYRTAGYRIEGVVLTFLDITARKQMKADLHESEARLQLAANFTGFGVHDYDAEANRLYWSAELKAMHGLPEDADISIESIINFVHAEDRERIVKAVARALDPAGKGEFEEEFRIFRVSDGAMRWIYDKSRTIFTGKGRNRQPVRNTGIIIDVTKRKQSEEFLRESKERLHLLIESMAEYAIITMTLDNHINSWSAGAEKMFGYTEKEILGQSAAIIFTPEDRADGRPEKEIQIALDEGRAPDERFHLRRDGSRFYVSGVMTLLKDAAGEVEGFVKIARDMTDRIEAEAALRDKEILQRMVKAQEDERKRIARDLHDELGQQLTALRLKLENARKLCDDQKLCAEIEETQIIAQQIDADVDFLAWELRPAALDDLGLLATLSNYVKEWARWSNIKAEFHSTGLKRVQFMPEVETNLYRIAQETLNNIHKHAQAKQVSIMLEKRDGAIVLIIEDDGIGFDPDIKMVGDKGLGLIGINERAALLGGTSEIESETGKGTTVFVRVPLQK